jgi:protein TonB
MKRYFCIPILISTLAACTNEINNTQKKQPKTRTVPLAEKQTSRDTKQQDLTGNTKIKQPKIVKFIPPQVVGPDPVPSPDPWPGSYSDPYAFPDPPDPLQDMHTLKQDVIYDVTEILPEFPGGQTALQEYLKNTIQYSEQAKEMGLVGKVFVGFVVRDNGKITNVEIKRGVHELLDREAMRVIKSMPDWKPAMNNGKAVNCRMILPIKFNLDY